MVSVTIVSTESCETGWGKRTAYCVLLEHLKAHFYWSNEMKNMNLSNTLNNKYILFKTPGPLFSSVV